MKRERMPPRGRRSPPVQSRTEPALLGVDPVAHPLVDYLAAGVPVVLATDDPGLMLSDLRQQFALAARNDAVSYPTLKALAMKQHRLQLPPGKPTASGFCLGWRVPSRRSKRLGGRHRATVHVRARRASATAVSTSKLLVPDYLARDEAKHVTPAWEPSAEV